MSLRQNWYLIFSLMAPFTSSDLSIQILRSRMGSLWFSWCQGVSSSRWIIGLMELPILRSSLFIRMPVDISLCASTSSGTTRSFFSVPPGSRWRCFSDVVLIVNVPRTQMRVYIVFVGQVEKLLVPAKHIDSSDCAGQFQSYRPFVVLFLSVASKLIHMVSHIAATNTSSNTLECGY